MQLYIYETAALSAAFCWALGGFFAAEPSRQLGAIAFTRLRMSQVLVILCIVVVYQQTWQSLINDFWLICLSGIIGIFLGDTALFAAMRRIGPRRTAVMFATNGPMGAILGYLFLDEVLDVETLIGCGFVVVGVIVAILFGQNIHNQHALEETHGSLSVAVIMGLVAALCQAIGAILVKPALIAGADPIATSALRVGVSVIFLYLLLLSPSSNVRAQQPVTRSLFLMTAVSGILAMGVGMTLVLFALIGGKVGVVTVLSSTSPILVLPILWFKTKQSPTLGAWMAAIFVMVGSAMIFT